MNKNPSQMPIRSIFLSIEQREINTSHIAEPILLRRTVLAPQPNDCFNSDSMNQVYLVAAPQFKRYQDKNICQQYGLTQAQYGEFCQFFKEHSESSGQFIEASFIRALMLAIIKRKRMIVAGESDVDRALNCFGTFLSIDEFLTFMALFFANETNLMQRLRCFLINTNESCHNEFLLAYEAARKYEFFKNFYGVLDDNDDDDDDSDDDENYEYFKHNLAMLSKMKTDEPVSVYEFLKVVYPLLEKAVFVKWKI